MNNAEVSTCLLDRLLDSRSVQSCLNCMHWNLKEDQCMQFNAKPPAQTIVYSCGANWKPDIPF